jgi:hypothetical protein
MTRISMSPAEPQSIFSPQKCRPFQATCGRKSLVLQLLDNPPVQITVPADIASNHQILDLIEKAATTTFKALNENYQNAFRNGIVAALRMGIFFTLRSHKD